MSIATVGDWDDKGEMLGAISEFMFEKNWTIVDDFVFERQNYALAKHNSLQSYVIGRTKPKDMSGSKPQAMPQNEFGLMFRIRLTAVKNMRYKDKGEAMGYSNLHVVDGVAVDQGDRGAGIAKTMYKWLISQGVLLLGDRDQYFGARRLWVNLSKDSDVTVDIINYDTDTVIDRNVILTHGKLDAEFDKRVWSYGSDKEHIRLVLRRLE